ncbi:hypothetical protein A0H81_08292 [Grifola frondosa]|uniref:Uncharacterized protein n=1 Tax=Grifola frondosa TaxID=5627 RepID=A0A1C7M5K3_GRIFR|nr:hypothetical protein A0H81_08292 [Grifola frondosa]
MTSIVDVSGKLGEYMLKGWILTDKICAKCSKVPLMRSPTSPDSYFCANCDSSPSPGSSLQAESAQPNAEVSSALSSPTFALPVDTEEILRRRLQSDTASAEIGRRMLRGWTMLADECPNTDCYGVPLVRPPKAGPEKDPRKECVICGSVYVDGKDALGQDRLVPFNSTTEPESHQLSHVTQSRPAVSSGSRAVLTSKGKEKAIEKPETPPMHSYQTHPYLASEVPMMLPPATSSTSSALGVSAQSLELSLYTLSGRLKYLASAPVVDVSSIGQTADAISKVSQALTQVTPSLAGSDGIYSFTPKVRSRAKRTSEKPVGLASVHFPASDASAIYSRATKRS